MKNYYILLTAFLISFVINAQIIDIPDGTFKLLLVTANNVDNDGDGNLFDNTDTNDDGEIDVNEALAVTRMDISVPFNVGWTPITSLEGIQYFTNLQYLNFANHNVTSIDLSALTALNSINCSRNELTSLDFITNPTVLETLDCSLNPFITVDLSPYINLKDLTMFYCSLNTLDLSNLSNLESLNYSHNFLPSVNLINQTNLIELNCGDNGITDLGFISSLDQLQELYCGGNEITSLDLSINELRKLNCNNNLLTNINISNLPNLEELDCGDNQLTSIELPDNLNLTKLDFDDNLLTEIDLLPVPNLTDLLCNDNQLTELNISHLTNLYWIDFSGNFLTSFDTNGVNDINYIFGSNNLLTTVSVKDGYSPSNIAFYVEYGAEYNFGGNPIEVICVDPNTVEEGYFSGGDYNIGSYCTFTPGGEYYTLQGQAFFDNDGNGCDETDVVLPNLFYHLSSNFLNGSVISNDLGEYAFYLGVDNTYTVYPVLENPSYFNISPENQTVNFPTDTSPFIQDFCVTPNGTFNDLEITIIPFGAARPGFNASYRIIYKNKGSTMLSGEIDFGFQDDLIDFVSATPTENSQAPNALTWTFTNLTPFESRVIDVTMNLNSPMETPPVNGDDILTFTTSISSSETDETPDDNTFELHQTVVNSYDPNDKTCLEGDFISPEMVGEYVHYMIRFENTGTADAINIVVKDDIDITKYDIATLVPLHASHNYVARIKDNASTQYVEFIFENINLPFDDANNDGYIVFKIKTLDTLVLNDTFENDAEIYFDFNFPIITNNEQTTVATLSSEEFELADNSIALYPNPTTHSLNLESKEAINHITIYDISGRLINEIAIIGLKTELTISTEALSTGTYFVKINTETSDIVKKIIKD